MGSSVLEAKHDRLATSTHRGFGAKFPSPGPPSAAIAAPPASTLGPRTGSSWPDRPRSARSRGSGDDGAGRAAQRVGPQPECGEGAEDVLLLERLVDSSGSHILHDVRFFKNSGQCSKPSTRTHPRSGLGRAGPDLPIEIDLFDGNHSLGTVKAELLRQDLLRAGKGKDRHGL